ncbi:BioY protein [Alkaliphilus oremlandii OhILAs]|uniref:Biotin transporter n=2 Tax=Alkaliphilus oremlandii TaxID=461876 RepID=A8MHI8_ALKOO|nr:BioY protein [Alkaliphilus oremlandii OhILAs]
MTMNYNLGVNKGRRISVSEMTKISLCTALLAISSYIVFPIPFTPIMLTAQTIIVNLIGLILTPLHGAISVLLFIVLGAIGLPIFAGGAGGLSAILGPTGGFIIGFLFSAIAISYLKGRKTNILRYVLVTVFIGMPVTYLLGASYMSYALNMDYKKAIELAVIPFLLGDAIKCVIASIIAARVHRILENMKP